MMMVVVEEPTHNIATIKPTATIITPPSPSSPPHSTPLATSTAVSTLDLSCSKLAWLPRERFVGFVGVTELVLNNNRLSRLPHELFALPNVRVARLEFNELIDLPAELGQWRALEVLVVHNNRLKRLPPQVGRLRRLRHLNLHCNQLTTLPTSLLELDIRTITLHANPALSENLKRICQAVFALREDTLDLSHCGPIRDQVEEQALGYARLTRELRIEGNALHALPTAVGQFFRLQSLLADDNQISAIPVHLCKLPALARLSLADNRLANLPAEIGLLSSLRSINMDNNFLSVLPPAFFHLVNLEGLSLANNKIESVSGDVGKLKKLQSLNMANNKIRTLPQELFTLTQLQSLHLEHNSISVLPDGFSNLRLLREVNLHDNLLTSTPVQLYQLPNIRRLSFENNPIALTTHSPQLSNSLSSIPSDASLAPPQSPQRLQVVHQPNLYLFSFGQNAVGRPAAGAGGVAGGETARERERKEHDGPRRDVNAQLGKRNSLPTGFGHVRGSGQTYFSKACDVEYLHQPSPSPSSPSSMPAKRSPSTTQPPATTDSSQALQPEAAGASPSEKVKKTKKKGKKEKTAGKKEKEGKKPVLRRSTEEAEAHKRAKKAQIISGGSDAEEAKKSARRRQQQVSITVDDADDGDDGEKSIQRSHTVSLSSLPELVGKERGTSFALPPKHAPKSLQQASRGLPPPNFAKKNQRSRSLSQAYNMSPVQKEQLLQYQKQRKVQNSAATSPGGSIKRKGLKEAVPEQQVMNPLYLLFSPLSSTSPIRSGPTLPLPRRRYGTVSGRSLNASDRVVSSFGLVARRKLSHNSSGSSGGGSGSGNADEPERVVINPLLRLRTDAATSARGPDSPLPMTRFTTSSGAAPTIVSSMSGPITTVASPTRVVINPLTERSTVSRVGSPSSPAAAPQQPKMAESTKRALAKTSASLIDTTRGPHDPNNAAANGGDGSDTSKSLKKTFSSPDFNPNKRNTIARQQQPQPYGNDGDDDDKQRAAAVSSSVESSSNDDDDDNDDDEGNNGVGEEGEEYEEEIEDEEAVGDGELRAARLDDTWTTSEEDRGTDIESGGGGGSSSSIRSVPALNFSPLQHRLLQSSDSAEAQVVVNRSSSLQFEKLSSSNPEMGRARRKTDAQRRAKIAHFFGEYPAELAELIEEEFFSDNTALEEGKRKRRGKVAKVEGEGNATDRSVRRGDEEKRLSGLRNSTKEKRATTLLQSGSVTPSWNGVKNKRHLSIPAISPDDGITQGEFLETISSLQSNCNKRAIKVKGDQIMYDDKTAQDLFKWQEKNSELLASSDKTPVKGYEKSNVREKKSSSQYKGEREKEPQAELRPRKSSFFDDIPDEQELQFVHDENGTMRPMRGTLAKLVQLLAHEQGRDVEFESDFLYSFRDFTTPTDLFECLTQRFHSVGPMTHPDTYAIVRKRILYVLRRWMELLHYDFAENDHALFHALTEWMDTVPTQGLEGAFRKFREWTEARFIRNQDYMEERQASDDRPPVPYLPINVTSSSLHLLNLHPEEVARQMTLIESELFRKIQPHEWLNQSWTRPDKKKRAPGIMNMIQRFNDISGWLATEIVSASTVEHRVVLVNRFLVIAKKCLELKNFNGVMEILSGLETASVQRLKQTWHNLPRKSWDMFEELTDLMSLPQNFKKFRQRLNTLAPPCVPYIGIFLKDIIFIEQGAQEPDGRMINFEKRMMVAKIVRQMVSFQPYVYNLIPVEFIQEFLLSMKPLNEDDLYSKSLQLEGIGASVPATKKRHKSSMFHFPLGGNSPRRQPPTDYSSGDAS